MSTFIERMVGAAKLDTSTYEEVEHDASAMAQAAAVVVLASVAAGIGTMAQVGWLGLIIGTIFSLVGWIIWAALTWLIGTKVLPEKQTEADVGQLMRTLGFSATPGILRILALIPGIGWILALLAAIWMLVAMVVAVRQALDYSSTWRAVGVCIIGFIIAMLVQGLVFMLLGGPAPVPAS